MVAMKSRLFVLLLCASLFFSVQARAKTILPDACGDDSVKFDVSMQKDRPVLAPPPDGKAQIVFVESWVKNMPSIGGGPIVRFGMDGAWVGANKGDSYFALTVDPGVHHLCASVQTISGRMKKNSVGMTSFTAELGKTYYYQFTFTQSGGMVMGASGPGVTNGGGGMQVNYSFDFAAVPEDEGKYHVKASQFATSSQK
jgi:hypothetical protein